MYDDTYRWADQVWTFDLDALQQELIDLVLAGTADAFVTPCVFHLLK